MKKQFALFLTLGLILSLAFISCKKDVSTTTDSVISTPYHPQGSNLSTSLAGLGEHPGSPSGTLFSLPPFIKVIGHMTGGIPGKKDVNYPKDLAGLKALLASMTKTTYTEYGYGIYVNIYVSFYNSSSSSYKLIIPAGLILRDTILNDSIPLDTSDQGGIIIVPDTIPIGGEDTTPCILKSFCINQGHPAPYSGHHYSFSAVSNNDQITQVVSILRNKKTLADHLSEIQMIIWNITDGAGLTQENINTMNSWQ